MDFEINKIIDSLQEIVDKLLVDVEFLFNSLVKDIQFENEEKFKKFHRFFFMLALVQLISKSENKYNDRPY